VVSIRAARVDEASQLTRLALDSKRYWGYDDAFMERCAIELVVAATEITDGNVFVIENVEGIVQGFYSLKDHHDDGGELAMLFVEPNAIGDGYGKELMLHARRRARARGWSWLCIESDPFAEDFYLSQGAERIGEVISPSTGRALALLRCSVL
jgi:GNAT superfamily N-acetyltransferase